jgi:Uma2 family endonuclease
MPLPKEKERYTYRDYCQWDDGERWELIDGIAYNMSPAPNFRHQGILMNLSRIVSTLLKGKPCITRFAPTDVVFSDCDVVQPDLFIVCDRKKITEKNVQGAPDVVFEIISPSTSKKDRWEKKALYEKYGVKEYIVVFPDGEYVERYLLLEDGHFDKGEVLEKKETLLLKAVPGLEIPLPEVFEFDIEEESPNRKTADK